MPKRLLWTLLLMVCLPLSAFAGEGAERPSYALLEGEGYRASYALAMEDGGLLLTGTRAMEAEGTEGTEETQRQITAGFAARMGPAGDVVWTVCLGDPDAQNEMISPAALADGRILLHLRTYYGSLGDMYLVVNDRNGRVEAMLETAGWQASRRLASLAVWEDGYLATGLSGTGQAEDPYVPWMARLDGELEAVWEAEYPDLNDHYDLAMEATGDGVVSAGFWEGTRTGGRRAQGVVYRAGGEDGAFEWVYTDEVEGASRYRGLLAEADGVVAVGEKSFAPESKVHAGGTYPLMTWLDGEGNETGTVYVEYGTAYSFTSVVRLGDGRYAVSADALLTEGGLVLRVEADGRVSGRLEALPPFEGWAVGNVRLAAGENGVLWAWGDMQGPQEDAPVETFCVPLEEEMFEAVE